MKPGRKLDELVKRNLRASDARERDHLRERILEEMTRIFMRTVHERKLFLETTVDIVARIMDAERVSILVRRNDHLVIGAARGLDREVIHSTRIALGEGVAGFVASTGRPVFMTDEGSSSPDMTDQLLGGARYKTPSFISLPLVTRGRVHGVLSVTNPRARAWFTEYDRMFLQTIVDVVSLFLRRTTQHTVSLPVI
ncbi:MAG: GAF domain-containing protein [Deltaproteobacteria bacterium]|nr:GAF domain-containing protein [Deltaproteobacteria bacterium]